MPNAGRWLRRTRRCAAVAAVGVLLAGSAAHAAAPPASVAASPPAGTTYRYDDLPPATAGRSGLDLNRVWPSPNVRYRFVNDTPDIAGTVAERQSIRDGMALWRANSKVRFGEVTAGGDILIQFAVGNHGDGTSFDGVGGVLAHAFSPPPEVTTAIAGDTHFDDAETWTTASRADGAQPIDLQTVAAHELGHALGLPHSTDPNSIMFPTYSRSHRFLAPSDITAINQLYP